MTTQNPKRKKRINHLNDRQEIRLLNDSAIIKPLAAKQAGRLAEEALRRSEEAAKNLAQENATMAEIGRIISSTLNIDEVYERFAEEARKLIPFDRIAIRTISPKDDTTAITFISGVDVRSRSLGDTAPLSGSVAEECTRTQSPFLFQPESADETLSRFPNLVPTFEAGLRSMIFVPLISKDQVIGILSFQAVKAKAYTERELRLAERVSHQIAGTIASAQLFTEHRRTEEALRTSEKRYRTLAETAQDMIFIIDTNDHVQYVNSFGARQLGRNPEQIIGKPRKDFFPSVVSNRQTNSLQKVFETGKALYVEDESFSSNDKVWLSSRLVPITNDAGEVAAVLGISRNVTERKMAEESLQASEERAKRIAQENAIMAEVGRIISLTLNIEEVYERFAEEVRKLITFDRIAIRTVNLKDNTAAIAYISGVDVENHRLADTTPLSGSVAEECIRNQSSLLLQPESVDEVVNRFPNLVPTLKAGLRSMMFVPLISKDQVIGVLSLQTTKPKAYTGGDLRLAERVGDQIAGAIANAQLFIQLKRTEEALRESERKFRDLYDNAPLGYHEYNLEGQITKVNQTDLEMLGYTAEEMIGRPIWTFNVGEEIVREQVLAKLAGTLPPGRNLERTYRRKDGTTFPVLIQDRLILDEKRQIKGIRCTIQDITGIKQAEESLQRSEERAKRIAQENVVMAEIGRVISSTLNIDDVYERFAERVRDLIPFDRIAIRTINAKDSTVTNAYTSGVDVESLRLGDTFSLSGSVAEKCMRTQSSFLFDPKSIEEVANRFPQLLSTFRTGLRSMIFVPLISKDQAIGVLSLQAAKPKAYGEKDLKLAERIGNQIAGAIANSQLFTERKRAEKEVLRQSALLEGMNRILRETLTTQTDEEIAQVCLSVAEELTGSKFGFIGELDQAVRLNTIALSDPGWISCKMPKSNAVALIRDMEIRGIWGRVLKDERTLLVNDPASHPDRVGIPEGHPPLTSFLGVPLKKAGKTIGMIALANKEPGYDVADQQVVETLATGFVEALNRHRAEEALRKSEIRFQELFDDAPVGYHELEVGGHITRVNRTELEMLGYAAEEMLGQPIWKFVMEEEQSQQSIMAKITGVAPPGRQFERTYRRKDGTTFPVLIEDRLLRDAEGRIIGIRSTIQDITDRKRTEEEVKTLEEQLRQSQKIEAIGRLAGGVAHDFNNLLTVIKGYSQLSLLDLKENTPLWENIQEIQKATQRATDLTRQLLAFSRRQILDPKVLDLNSLLRDTEKMLRRMIGEDIELVTLLSEDLGRVKIDPSQIEQVIFNLAVNARDAMPSGGKLTIETANVESDEGYALTHVDVIPGHYVRLSVSDTGVGMSREVQEKAFDPFFTTKDKGKGTGLGLSTVHGIVTQSGGKIWVYSEPGHGTTFKIYFPTIEGELDNLNGKNETDSSPGGSETVLLVEDELSVRDLANRLLKQQGYRVLEAANGEEALRLVQENTGEKIHLLLTDVVLPQMGGKELADQLKILRPGLKVLYTSGYTDYAIVHHGVLNSGTHFLQKPFSLKTLSQKVREVLDR